MGKGENHSNASATVTRLYGPFPTERTLSSRDPIIP
jgi:hypothetical protein